MKVKNIVLLLIIVVFILACLFILTKGNKIVLQKSVTGYLASNTSEVTLYQLENIKEGEEEKEELKEVLTLPRGTKIKYYEKNGYTKEEKEYLKTEYDKKDYYVLKDNIKSKEKDVVLETELYVRTATNLKI